VPLAPVADETPEAADVAAVQEPGPSESRLVRMMRSPRVLGALAVLYAALPSLVSQSGDDDGRLRILSASGALLGAIPAVAIARRLDAHVRVGILLLGALCGAVLFSVLVWVAMGGSVTPSDLVKWELIFPSLAYASSAALMLTALCSADEGRAGYPITAALALAAFGVVPLGHGLSIMRATLWFPRVSQYWLMVGGGLLLTILALAHWLPTRVSRLTRYVADRMRRPAAPVFVGLAALFIFAASAVFAVFCFGRQPHNADEVAQLWHARILLSGHLSLPVDANPEFFGMDNVIDRGRWYSQFPIGGPAFLALGMAAHAAWLVNPLLLALTVPNVHRFARAAFGEATARAAVLLFALSPMVLFMGASFMNHVPVLWLVSVALAQLTVWMDAERRADAWRSAALMGLALGVAATVRPLDAALVGIVIGVMQLTRLRGSTARRESLIAQVVAGAIPVALLLWANALTTGAPLRFGYEVLYGSAHQLGFHTDPYGGNHTPVRALLYASKYLMQLDVALLQAPLPAVGLIVAGLLLLRRPTRWDAFLLALLGVQLVGFALYWHEGTFRGPRFLFTALPAIVILLARAPFLTAEATGGTVRRAAPLVLPVCMLVAWSAYGLAISVPGQALVYRDRGAAGRINPDVMAREAGLHHALVFVREGWESGWLRRLWALGIPRPDAMRLFDSADPCGLREAIVAEERTSAPAEMRLARLNDRLSRFDASAELSNSCMSDLTNDGDGVASYAPFLPANQIGADGRVTGDVIYVLDLRERNELLRERFGDRTWYRLRPHRTRNDPQPRLTPYVATTY
jgi:4-amino-4-deoxy-L-arabinose transferase-like glycosyltransferase